MSDTPVDAAALVPSPTPAPAEQELTAEEILGFDAADAVERTSPTPSAADDPIAVLRSLNADPATPVTAGVGHAAVELPAVDGSGSVSAQPPDMGEQAVDGEWSVAAGSPVSDTETQPLPVALPEPVSARVSTTCPSCGASASIDFARRDAADFCAVCDFPLFWSRDRVVLPDNSAPDESGLRRLPGTAGRTALASLLCPVCAEPNPATGVTCLRCGADLHPKPVAAPVVEAPAPVVVEEPEPDGRPWWPILLAGGLALVALAVVLVILYT